jgi:hypothetical protein
MVESFPNGTCSEDLKQRFQAVTSLKHAMFYNTLKFVKTRGWLVNTGEGRSRLYVVNHEAYSKASVSIGVEAARDEAEQLGDEWIEELPDISGNNGGAAISALVGIVADNRHTVRQRLKASATILGYKTQDPGIIDFVKRFLEHLCAADISADHRIWASELLRQSGGDARILPQILRPDSAPVRVVDPIAEEEARRIEFLRKKEHCDRLAAEIERELGLPRQRSN